MLCFNKAKEKRYSLHWLTFMKNNLRFLTFENVNRSYFNLDNGVDALYSIT